MRPVGFCTCGALLALAIGCGAPVVVKRVDAQTVARTLTRNALTVGRASQFTINVVYERGLVDRLNDDPEGALAELRADALADGEPDDMFALAELSFLHAEDTGERSWDLAAAIYAWSYLFPEGTAPKPSPFDARFRIACDLYNRGITSGFKTPDGRWVDIRGGTYELPFGTLEVALDPSAYTWSGRTLSGFVPVAEMQVTGLPTRYRWPGLGAPLAAKTARLPGHADDFLREDAIVPVTALLRLDGARRALDSGRLRGTMELRVVSGFKTADLEGEEVPLENESTATLAYMLADAPFWKQEISGFLSTVVGLGPKAQLRAMRPYRPGRIPVVFVHGTASSAGRWAEMLNELDNDPRLAGKFQFWFFSYDTGNPILYSAMILREALTERVAALDPDGTDWALHQMVVIGHSQGGLLTKLTAVDSGSAFWDGASKLPFDQVQVSPETKDLLHRAMFVSPLPFVKRLVFIATPQRGSYVAGSWIAQQAARLVSFPANLLKVSGDLLGGNRKQEQFLSMKRLPTAVDNMTPGNNFIKVLASLPVAPDVHAHSIIAVKGEGAPQGKDDGVVEYDSAHIDGVDSELVVRSPHSCQDNPHTIAEVRRILLLHLAAVSPEPARAAQ